MIDICMQTPCIPFFLNNEVVIPLCLTQFSYLNISFPGRHNINIDIPFEGISGQIQ